jgi:hypothetical protein
MSPEFIEQTARDYDMPVHEVEKIARLYPNEFYEKLENYISERAKK